MSKSRIGAVVVTYNPEPNRFKKLLESLTTQVDTIYIVDNNSNVKVESLLADLKNACFIPLDDNFGIAYAQNIGINRILDSKFDFVMLVDHDSIPEVGMVEKLLKVSLMLVDNGVKVAAVGPRYLDSRQNNPPPFIEIRGLQVIRKSCSPSEPVVPVSYLIASGSLISVSALKAVGLMEEDLFVDYVDIEWGLRAKLLGYRSFGVCTAFMDHDLGDDPISFLGKSIPLHSPLRHYYLFRNAIYLYKQSYFPLAWKIGDFYRLMLKYGFYTLFAKPRWKHFSMMTKGILDGLLGRMGKYSGA